MNIGQNIQQAKLGMVPNATIVAQEILGNMDMSLVLTQKGITNVISAIWFCIGRERSSKVGIYTTEVVFIMKVCFSAAKYNVHQASIGPKLPLIFSRFYLADRLSESR